MAEQVKLPNVDGEEVQIIEICVKVGDFVNEDEPLIVVETQKASMDIPAPFSGVIKALHINEGDKITEGILICEIDKNAQNGEKVEEKVEEKTEEKAQIKEQKFEEIDVKIDEKTDIKTDEKTQIPQTEIFSQSKIYASPSIRRLAQKYGVNLSLVKGSARKGRIQKEDVRNYIKQSLSGEKKEIINNGLNFNLPSSKEIDFSKFGEIEIKELSKIQKISGPSLHKNYLSMPHITQFDECDITELESFRQAQNVKNLKLQNGIKLSPLIFVLKAVAKTLQVYPKFNTSLNGESLIYKKYIHIGVAVDTPNGLVVPVIRDVDKKGLNELANELKEISQKARDGKLKLQDMQGGCFTISSLGGIGGTYFTPIINAPEVAILGLSKSQLKPIWNGKEFKPRLILPLSLSYDHKVIDGADGARFTALLSEFLSDIKMLLL